MFNNYDIIGAFKNKECDVLDLKSVLKINVQNVTDNDFYDHTTYKIRVELDTSYNTPIEKKDAENIKSRLIDILAKKVELDVDDILASSILLPKDFENLTFSSEGAAAGWAPDSSFTDFRSFQKQVADNFFQVGCWDKHGSGIFPIFLSAKDFVDSLDE